MTRRRTTLLATMLIFCARTLAAQTPAAIAPDQLAAYAKAYTAIGKLRDRLQAEMAEPQNKKDEAQEQLHAKMRLDVAKIFQESGFTEAQYNGITFTLSTSGEARLAFDKLMGITPPAPPPGPAMSANTHVGHVLTSFTGTPSAQGLLPTALAEARVVIQHAALAARSTRNLEAMKLHAGHVLHALDPAAGATGPGAGYGLKKAAAALATHVELAAKAEGAAPAITTHALHIAASARNTAWRAERLATLARQVQAATSADAAAMMIAELNGMAGQLMAGNDANSDGKITWEEGEGGLQHVEQHVALMIR